MQRQLRELHLIPSSDDDDEDDEEEDEDDGDDDEDEDEILRDIGAVMGGILGIRMLPMARAPSRVQVPRNQIWRTWTMI